MFEHNGSVAALEDRFDLRRLRDDYVPSGWKGCGAWMRGEPAAIVCPAAAPERRFHMNRTFIRIGLTLGVLGSVSAQPPQTRPSPQQSQGALRDDEMQAARARQTVERVLPLLQSSARIWFQNRKCASCHHQGLGMTAVALARERGFKIDEAMLAEQVVNTRRSLAAPERFIIGDPSANAAISLSYLLMGLASGGCRRTARRPSWSTC
jgi:hypothetical protein